MIHLRRAFYILSFLCLCSAICNAQSPNDSLDVRKGVLAEAHYLKSIYKTDEAIEKLSSLVNPEKFDEQVLSELADCHFQSGDYETAAGTYFLLSAAVPGNILYKIRLMQIHSRTKAWPQCIQTGKEVLQLDTIPAVLSVIGDGFCQIEKPDSALWYYRRALAYKPMNENVLSKAMIVLINEEDYDGAIDLSKPFLAEDPDNNVIAPLQGLAHYRKGDYESTISVLQRQEDIGNDTYPIHYYLGQSYWHTNLIAQAEKELTAAWQIDTTDANLAYSIAAVKIEALRPFETVKPWLDKALEMILPDSATMYRIHHQYGLGYYRSMNSWDKAIEHYKEAYKYYPKYIQALTTIAYCYEQKKDYKQAIAWYNKYLAVAKPGSKGYEFATDRIAYLKGELFMEE